MMVGTMFTNGSDASGCISVRGSEGIFIDDAGGVTCRQNPTRKLQLICNALDACYKQRIATPWQPCAIESEELRLVL
jgi:hypothetical protein